MSDVPEATPEQAPRAPGRRQLRTRQQVQERRRRIVTYVIVISSAVLMVNALVGETGYLAKLRAHREIAALRAEVAEIQQENLRLADEAERLKHDPNTIEAAARQYLGLMKPGEVVVIVPPSSSR